MRVLLDHPLPFALAHGGLQIQIEQTKAALAGAGVEVEFLRWWDEAQRADIIHYFGRPSAAYIHFAHEKRMRVVMAELLTGLGSRSAGMRWAQRTLLRTARGVLPGELTARMGWEAYRRADALVALTSWEAELMTTMFDAPAEKVHVVPNGVETAFLSSRPAERGIWLVCTATITRRKRVVKLAEAAVAAQTPIWILGKAYATDDAYANRLSDLASRHPQLIRFEGAMDDRHRLAGVYREARGFVLLSERESLSLSALEAAACDCPLLLSDLPWARSVFAAHAEYCPVTGSEAEIAKKLRAFYVAAPQLPRPPKPKSWPEVALMLKSLYERVLNTSR